MWESSPWALTAQMAAVLVPQLRGAVPFGAAPWQWPPESSCARAAFQELAHSGQWQGCAQHTPAQGEHGSCRRWGSCSETPREDYRARLRLLELPSNGAGSLVQCWLLQRPRGAHFSGGVMVMVHPPPQATGGPEVTGVFFILGQSCNCCAAARSLC